MEYSSERCRTDSLTPSLPVYTVYTGSSLQPIVEWSEICLSCPH